MISRRKFITISATGVASCLLAEGLVGCGNAQSSGSASNTAANASKEEKTPESVTVVDHANNEVTVPYNIERVVIDQVPIAASYVCYMGGSAERLVGLSGNVLKAISKTALVDIAPEIKDVSTNYYENGELNVEELLNLKPDVVLYNSNNTEHGELFKQAGLKAVGFSTDGDPTELYARWLRLLDDVFHREDTLIEDLISYGDKLIGDVKQKSLQVKEADKKKVLILFNYDSGQIRVSGSQKHFGHWWLENMNVVNAAEEVTGVAQVTLEQIYGWAPDEILMPGPGQCAITTKQVLENTVEGLDFAPLKAVQNGQVYSCELGMWSWYTPNSDAPLVQLWMAQKTYPSLFADYDIRKETSEYYKKFYNYDLSDAELDYIFDPEGTNA